MQTVWYRSPEVYFKIPLDVKMDIWSVGCIIYEIIEYKALFKVKKDNDILIFHLFLGEPSREFIEEFSQIKRHITTDIKQKLQIYR